MDKIVYLPLSPDMAVDTASKMAEAVVQCMANIDKKGGRDPGSIGHRRGVQPNLNQSEMALDILRSI